MQVWECSIDVAGKIYSQIIFRCTLLCVQKKFSFHVQKKNMNKRDVGNSSQTASHLHHSGPIARAQVLCDHCACQCNAGSLKSFQKAITAVLYL